MNIIFLKDLEDGCTDAIIITETSTKEDVERAIKKEKATNSNYDWESLMNSLPSDCVVHDRWNSEAVYY